MLFPRITAVTLLTICVSAFQPKIGTATETEIEENEFKALNVTTINSNVIDLSDENIPPELENWETPPHLVKDFPYYLSGFDYEDRPIWISEMGKYNLRKVIEAGSTSVEQFDNFTKQAALRVYRSHKMRDPTNSLVCYIVDFEGLNLYQIASVPTVAYTIKLVQEFGRALGRHTHVVIIVNANYISETLLNLVRPLFGGFVSRFEIYGSNRSKWVPRILRHFPKDQIPEWYGGHKNFAPYAAYG